MARNKRRKLRFARKKKAASGFRNTAYWVFSFALTLWFSWVIYAPSPEGILSGKLSVFFDRFFGQSEYLFPLLLIYGLFSIFSKLKKPNKGIITLLTANMVILSSLSSLLNMAQRHISESFEGGWLGSAFAEALSKIFGETGVAIFSAALFVIGLKMLFKVSMLELLKKISRLIAADYRNWISARRELKIRLERMGAGAKEEVYDDIEPIEEPPPPPEPRREKENPENGDDALPPRRGDNEKAEDGKSSAERGNRTAPPAKGDFSGFRLPDCSLLEKPENFVPGPSKEELSAAREKLEETFRSFNISAYVSGTHPGPVITRYDVTPSPGVKINSIVSLSNDIALAMKAPGIRVIPHIPGKSAIGFEIPNQNRRKVYLREILESPEFNSARAPLTVALGRHSEGSIALANIERMPHLLVAGATNSGKSVFLHSLIMSLIYRNTPDELKFLMIDPKRLELTFYEDIPYLYDPKTSPESVTVVTNPKAASKSLASLIRVMEARYMKFERARVKNITGYNEWADRNNEKREFYIVVVIDELADLILQTKNVVEDAIQRLSQMARAVGIHLILATQRPSVDVITGVIKANLPTRIALQVTSKTDSRVIIDTPGAEALIGRGDLLYLASDAQKPVRIQAPFVSEKEILEAAKFVKQQGAPSYDILKTEDDKAFGGKGGTSREILSAMDLILQRRRVSQDLLKAHFGSSARATNLLSILEMNGFIRKPEGSNRWEINFDRIEEHLQQAGYNPSDKAEKGVL